MVKCEIKNCETIARYGLKQEFSTRCKKHLKKNMVYRSRTYCSHGKQHKKCEDCKDDLICGVDGCKNKSTYGEKQGFPTRCKNEKHREERMVTQPLVYCFHNKRRYHCIECEGASICEHGRQRNLCKDCNGASICEHGRQRNLCKDCNGASICEHGRRHTSCKECRGASICKHKRRRSNCSICEPESNHFCKKTDNNGVRCATKKNSKYDNYCAACFVILFPDNPKAETAYHPHEEHNFRLYLTEKFHGRFIYNKQLIIADKEKGYTTFDRRPDAQAEFPTYILIIELDEDQHKSYDMKDQELRIKEIYHDAGKDLIVIRLNPDKYIINGKTMNTKMEKRYEILKDTIDNIINKIESGYKFDSCLTEIKLFFDDESKTENDTDIYCAGFSTRAKRRCRRKVTKEGDFCYRHVPNS